MMATCRFAHYMQAMMRDRIGSFMSRDQAETFLQTWISAYVLDQDDASQEYKARQPLRSAKIEAGSLSRSGVPAAALPVGGDRHFAASRRRAAAAAGESVTTIPNRY